MDDFESGLSTFTSSSWKLIMYKYHFMRTIIAILFSFLTGLLYANEGRITISLNGEWEFEQTVRAFAPEKFTRKIPVPGLIHLATPRIDEYEKFFKKGSNLESVSKLTFLNRDYTPKYSWYKREISIDKSLEGKQLYLTIKKSQFQTYVYVNGRIMGQSMECYTPITLNITDAINFGEKNEIIIQVGDRAWLSNDAAGSIDQEKIHYLPGIWDDVFISVTGDIMIDKALFLPSFAQEKVTVKAKIRSAYPPQMRNSIKMFHPCKLEIRIKEKKSGKMVAKKIVDLTITRNNDTFFETILPVENPKAWSPEAPFLYEGEIEVIDKGKLSDLFVTSFGIRDFTREGRFFALNGEKYYLRGSNITLHRFFEDPDCSNLAWNKEWVKKMLIDIPKSVNWNAMRICVGIVPDFWNDLCDEYGIVLQNEWMYWQNNGKEDQIRKEYSNWVWSDGNHPSIVIWDAINENKNTFIGNVLIPELKKLDPTRIWDAGYMTGADMTGFDEMDEPHPYRTMHPRGKIPETFLKKPYTLGDLNVWDPRHKEALDAGVPQLVNEYGWMWLWRDGTPSKLSFLNFDYYLGPRATSEERWNFQAYWLQLETELLRTERSMAGILSFCLLTNNYGFTGDWFMNNIKDLEISPTLKWHKHSFAPQAVFINLPDQRYNKHIPVSIPGSNLLFTLIGINDYKELASGKVHLKLFDNKGKIIRELKQSIEIPSFGKREIPCMIQLPAQKGGYLLVAEFYRENKKEPTISRRYLKIGDASTMYSFFEIQP